jgi:LmbE family N-acetylglucosaminyl deacetylase
MMQRLTRLLLTLGLAVGSAAVARAQIAVSPQAHVDFAQIHLLRNDSVQKELKLSEAQARKLKEIFSENQESTREIWQKYPPPESTTHWQELTKELRKDALAVLTEAQRARFWQIDFQNTRNFGYDSSTFQRADVDKKLDFTDEQKHKLRAIQANTQKKNQAASKPPNMYQQKIAEIRKEDREQVAALLTDGQKQKWDELAGKPFVIVNINPNADLQKALSKWIRDDFARAQADSRKTGKPIFAIFRCEP